MCFSDLPSGAKGRAELHASRSERTADLPKVSRRRRWRVFVLRSMRLRRRGRRTWARERTPGFNDYAKWVHTFLPRRSRLQPLLIFFLYFIYTLLSLSCLVSAYSNEPGAYYMLGAYGYYSLCSFYPYLNTSREFAACRISQSPFSIKRERLSNVRPSTTACLAPRRKCSAQSQRRRGSRDW